MLLVGLKAIGLSKQATHVRNRGTMIDLRFATKET